MKHIELQIKLLKECIKVYKFQNSDNLKSIEKCEQDIRHLENESEFPYFLRNYVDSYSEMIINREDHIAHTVKSNGYQFVMDNLIKEPRQTGRSTRIILEMFRDILYKGEENPIFIACTAWHGRDLLEMTARQWLNDDDQSRLFGLMGSNLKDICKTHHWLHSGCTRIGRIGNNTTIYFDHYMDRKTEEWIRDFERNQYTDRIKIVVG